MSNVGWLQRSPSTWRRPSRTSSATRRRPQPMAAKLPAEKQRRSIESSTGYIVRITGGWEVSGEGDTLKEAEAQAEAVYTAHRRNLLAVGEALPDDVLADKVAACLYLRNVQVTTGGLHANVVRWED